MKTRDQERVWSARDHHTLADWILPGCCTALLFIVLNPAGTVQIDTGNACDIEKIAQRITVQTPGLVFLIHKHTYILQEIGKKVTAEVEAESRSKGRKAGIRMAFGKV